MPYYDHDKDYPFAAFITNLGKYNEGELVGEWVKFPTTAEELKESFKKNADGLLYIGEYWQNQLCSQYGYGIH